LSSLLAIVSCDRGADDGGPVGMARRCVEASDCPAEDVCRQNVCVRVCQSDAECAPLGLTCDLTGMVCGSAVAPGSGGGSSGSDGSGASSGVGGGAGGASGAGTAMTTYDAIDDLEDGNDRILMSAGRQGPWHTFNNLDGGGNQTPAKSSAFVPESGGANGSQFAVHTTGDGYTFAGVGFDLSNPEPAPESAKSQSFDASAFDGIVFWAKAGDTGSAKLRVELPMRSFVPRDRGGTCDADCWNVYGQRSPAALTTTWQEYKVPFSALQREMGGATPTFDRSQLMSISFKHEGMSERFDFWIDDVRFYKDPPSSGGAGGAGGNSGTPSGACTFDSPRTGNGSFTWYHFSQGTGMEGDGYRTACGHFGREPSGMDSDVVENIATPGYFAAIPASPAGGDDNFDTKNFCGGCAEITNGSTTLVVTIIDACPTTSNPVCQMNKVGHLDLSRAAFNALGFSTGNPTGTSWRFVACPVTGNVKLRIKPGNVDQVYIENTIFPIQSVQVNGQPANHLAYGAWAVPGGDVNGKMLTLTDVNNRTITVPVSGAPGQNQDTGVQFPSCAP